LDDNPNDSDNKLDDNFISDEMFKISNINKKITATNLRINYMYRGEQLKNMCLYDYAATLYKIKTNKKELDKITRQKYHEERATRNIEFVNNTMVYLHFKNKLSKKKTIALRKQIEQTDDDLNPEKNNIPELSAYTLAEKNLNNLQVNLLQEISSIILGCYRSVRAKLLTAHQSACENSDKASVVENFNCAKST
ncbi:33803_t:CDS:2, partial [Racocetra persica]